MIITPTSLTVNQLFGSTNEQYVIPAYQRRYSWHDRQVWELIDDIRLIENNDTHLLGSIVCLTGHHTAGVNRLELVDGQQRLTTVSILLECLRQHFEKVGESDEASEVGRLLGAKALGGKPVRKVALDSIDSVEFERLVTLDLAGDFQNLQLVGAFKSIREWIATKPIQELGAFLYRLKNQAIVIRLDVGDAKDAFKLFETINNRGLRLSPTDIIKNFLLGNAARFGLADLELARDCWTKLILHLDGTNSDAFFRYYLMSQVHVRVTASEVVSTFKKDFMSRVKEAAKLPERHLYPEPKEPEEVESEESSDDNEGNDGGEVSAQNFKSAPKVLFREFLSKIVDSAKVYGELVLARTDDSRVDRHLRNLRMIKAVQTYGFLMHLRVGGCSDKHFREVLQATENFVLRRHVCRERANDTEALFARLCGVDVSSPAGPTKSAYRELCPADDKFREEFAKAEFPANLMDRARYCLERIEVARHGDYPELQVLGAEEVHVEHIIPQKIKTKRAKEEFGNWVEYLGQNAEALHRKYLSRIGNLTLFAGPLNIGASNNPFARKKVAYKESGIQITKDLVKLQNFKFRNVEQRSADLANVAVRLWPTP